jgi:hypothetical protein
MAALARRLSQAFRIASDRGVVGCFSLSGFSVVVVVIPPLKITKIFGHKIMGCQRSNRRGGNGGQQVSAQGPASWSAAFFFSNS